MILTFTDDGRADRTPAALDIRSTTILLVDMEEGSVHMLTDRGQTPAGLASGDGRTSPLQRRLWAARLRYWAEQFEREEG